MSSPEATAVFPDPCPAPYFGFDNTYARLDPRYYARLSPTPVRAPQLIQLNVELARSLSLDPVALAGPAGVEILAGNRVGEGSEPLAQAYAGHQFGSFVPRLGDGRAILLGEVIAPDGKRYDIQLKGSGPTPFSRNGDGRAGLGPVLREYLVSEAMAALGVPTTRALAAVATGDQVWRETALPGAVLTRVAASHLRIGTFEYFSARRDSAALSTLAHYSIGRHYPGCAQASRPIRALLDGVIARQAQLVAQWMLLGFIHGVMNTDNTSISGETIDYGPCAFMDAYDPATVFSFIDQQGRYAFGNQPRIALWNLTRLADALFPLLQQEEGGEETALSSATEALTAFAPQFEAAHWTGLRRKLGLFTEDEGDKALAQDLLQRMAVNRADFTLTFRRLCQAATGPEHDGPVRTLFSMPSSYDEWAAKWRRRLQQEPASVKNRAALMRQANPVFIPRNHLVEAALKAAVEQQDVEPFAELLELVTHPFEDRPDRERFTLPARPEERVEHTFCGT
jgi:serine/tyrosine/threonine adenylyltransferase